MNIRWHNSRSPLGRYVTCMWSVPYSSRTYCVPQAHLLYSVPDTVAAPYLAGIAPFTAALQLDLGVFNFLLCAGPGLGIKDITFLCDYSGERILFWREEIVTDE